ncbi:hypothetical protein CGQ25_15740 [Sinomonas sp. R1AF57]|nr:hypothetical protein CGQ25_15740 [Sinomonas sp. R1AF57]
MTAHDYTSRLTTVDESDFDPMTPEFISRPVEALDDLRATRPVAHSTNWGGFWALLNRDDVVAAGRNHGQFRNFPRHVVPGNLTSNTRPLMHVDQPEHTVYRTPIQEVLNSEALRAEVVDVVRARARTLVAELVANGSGDLCRGYAQPLMGQAIVSVFHIEDVTGDEFDDVVHEYTTSGQSAAVVGRDEDRDKMFAYNRWMEDVAQRLLDDRRLAPRDPATDLATALVALEADGRAPDEAKLIGALRQPFVIVWLATSHALANMFLRLLTDRGLQRRLREEPDLIAASVDEFLRMDQPQLGFARTASEEIEIGGRTIEAGAPVALVFPAANRDPKYFDDPHTFRIGRSPNPHLAFGVGIHSCPGHKIAKAIVEVALTELITGTGDLDLSVDRADLPLEHWPFHAPLALPTGVGAP